MLMLKPDELLVGSGDGNVCIVKDQTLKPSLFKKPSHDGIPKQVVEPTKPCLIEVWSRFWLSFSRFDRFVIREKKILRPFQTILKHL